MAQALNRTKIAGLVLSAAGLIGIVSQEGYTDKAVIPVPGDVPTIGFGTTEGVKLGDKTTPQKALARALSDVSKYEGAVKQCVKAPLYQYEYDAAISISYNIGSSAFCGSSIVRKFNSGDYRGACDAFLLWNKVKGKPLPGLTKRREAERKICLGPQQ